MTVLLSSSNYTDKAKAKISWFCKELSLVITLLLFDATELFQPLYLTRHSDNEPPN